MNTTPPDQSAGNVAEERLLADATRTAQDEVLAAIRSRLDAVARNDIPAWARFVADDSLAPLEGVLSSKQAWIREHTSWPSAVKYYYGPLEDIKVRVHGDTAIVSYRVKQYTDIGEQLTYQQAWQMETHMRRGSEWVLVAVADAPIAPAPTAAEVNPQVYDAYVGQYAWAPTLISVVTREGDRLFEESTGQVKVELLPENEATFFIKGLEANGDTSRFIFVKDERGQVSHYLYHVFGSTHRIVKKIK